MAKNKISANKNGANKPTYAQQVAATKRALRKTYTIWCIASAAVAVIGTAMFMLFQTEWGLIYTPIIATALTVLSWCLIARFVFVEKYDTLLVKSFTRTLKTALVVPVWLTWLMALMSLPTSAQILASNLATGLSYLFSALLLTVVPLAVLICGILSIIFAVNHWKTADEYDSNLYKEGPFALSLIVFIIEIALCIWLVTYFFSGF